MRLQLFTHLALAAFSAASIAACTGGQTGDLSGQRDDDDGTVGNETAGGCKENKQPLSSFDEATDAGTANELLAYAEGTFDAPITWKQGDGWTLTPETGAGTIHVAVTSGERAYLLSYEPEENDSGLDIAVICPPTQLGVEAQVAVTTDGGALAEEYDVLLRSSASGAATLSVPLDLTKLSGDLAVSFSNPNAKLVQTRLESTLTESGMTGRIQGMQQVDAGGVSSAGAALLAVWPLDPACSAFYADGEGLAVGVDDQSLGATGTETLAALSSAEPLAIQWRDGFATTLEVGLASAGDGCFRVRNDLPQELGGGPNVSYPVTVTLKSEDGRLDGSYLGQVNVTLQAGERRSIASVMLDLTVDDVEDSGFSGITVPTDSDGLRLQIESRREGDAASGLVRLVSFSNPPCLTEPQMPEPLPGGGAAVPGCAGQSLTELESASWGN